MYVSWNQYMYRFMELHKPGWNGYMYRIAQHQTMKPSFKIFDLYAQQFHYISMKLVILYFT